MSRLPWIHLSLLILLLSFSVGGWRVWHDSHLNEPLAGSGSNVTQIELLTTEDKASWVRSQVYLFNETYYDRYHIQTRYLDSRSAMQAIIQNKERPVMWSPESPIWIARLADYWKQYHGIKITDVDDPQTTHVYLQSPLVLLTTRPKAGFLRKLTDNHFWHSIVEFNQHPNLVPWGKLSYTWAYPNVSHSGIAVLGMSLNEYSHQYLKRQSIQTIVNSLGYKEYLISVRKGYIDKPICRDGTMALTNEFANNPSMCDFIVTYESLAMRLALHNKNLVVVYINPAESAEQVVCTLNEKWINQKQREAANQFLVYLNRPQTINQGIRYNMRPANHIQSDELDKKLISLKEQGFQQTYISEDAPPYEALNSSTALWDTLISNK